jgi:hypothetical protein
MIRLIPLNYDFVNDEDVCFEDKFNEVEGRLRS